MSNAAASSNPFLTVFVPAYNEAENLCQHLPMLLAALPQCAPSFEVIVVDDGSSDGTVEILDAFATQDKRVRVIRHANNRGIGAGFASAVAAAHGTWFILIPADLAIKLEELPKYFEAVHSTHADIVVGHRKNRADYSLFRRLVSFANIGLIRRLFGMWEQQQFNYISLYRTHILKALRLRYTHSALFFAEVLVRAKAQGYKLINVWVDYVPRVYGKQTGSNWRLIAHTVRDIFAFWLRWRFGRGDS
jgi:glycosyltransferase involved in cell wall biosynthesis